MGVIPNALSFLFGGERNVVADTVGLFRESSEAGAERDARLKDATLAQFAAEFAQPGKGGFDRIVDGMNRLPRPLLALGTLGLFGAAMVDPIWFASRMQGIALIPEPLWWLMGAIISFYFGARHQAKGQDFQRSIAETMTRVGEVRGNIRTLKALDAGQDQAPAPVPASGAREEQPAATAPNAALEEWAARLDR